MDIKIIPGTYGFRIFTYNNIRSLSRGNNFSTLNCYP